MAKFNLDDYELVEDRLKKYWKDNPQGMISTNVVHITEDGTCVTIKADVTDNNGRLVATGIAQETKGDGFANTTSWVENCETSAIGRALANWKYQGNKKARPSREEMAKVERNSETPTTDTKKKAEESVAVSSATSPIEQIKEAGFGDTKGAKHPNGALAIDEDGLICPCGSNARVKYYKAHEKSKPKSPDFRCSMMGQCVGGDTVDGKVFAKSWWMDNKATPKSWQDFASVSNGMTLPKPKSLDEIGPDDAPF